MKGKKNHKVYLVTGSNLGDKEENLLKGEELLRLRCGSVLESSRIYESEPWKMASDEWFLNQVHLISTLFSPIELLRAILQVEHDLGRERTNTAEYESRTMDIDILYYDDLIFESQELSIPHPRIQERRFVLVPMAELNSEMIHPVLGKSQRELLNICSDTTAVQWKNQR